ncbi:accessory gland protein Acp29AB-like [Drosophila elegans]|uniref:accessory gland protein Acp29AB-like n=1 Tax=Drosophila elegans TaxID=30023 RepID=UPI001BC865A1|nr:accessory gland protein Acp29AB-like [Drosophila elegans]
MLQFPTFKMFEFVHFFWYAFVACNLYGMASSENDACSRCILTDAPLQCGAFVHAALHPLYDDITSILATQKEILAILGSTQKGKVTSFDGTPQKLVAIEKETLEEKKMPPPGFQQIGKRYFYIEHKIELNWNEAENFCKEKGCHLVDFQSKEEFVGIREILKNDTFYWTGINDQAKTGKFVSVSSGKPVTFSKWYKENHLLSLQSGLCVAVRGRLLSSWPCDVSRFHFICQAVDY